MRLQKHIVIISLAVCLASTAYARGYRVDQVPGGHEFECYMCHFRNPFTRLTVMGRDAREHLLFREDYPPDLPADFYVGEEGNVDWAALALLDSDGDGYTNGEELGDPAGLFMPFDPQPDFPFTRPDRADDFPCGSGTVEGPEQCDGDAFGGLGCADFGWPGGRLGCRDDCTIDLSACNRCGDGLLDPGEACDGAPPVDAVCPDGTVGAPACVDCAVDLSGCRPPDAAGDAGVDGSVDGGGGEPADAMPADIGGDATGADAARLDAALDAAPADAAPADAAPADAVSAEPAPAEAAPTDAAPPDAAPTEAPPADTPTIDPARTHLMLRGGMHIYPDSAFHALADARNRGAVEIAADITLHHRLALGLAFHNGAITGDLYGEPTAFSEASLHLSALYRLRPHPALSAYARLGPTIDWYHLEIGTGRNAHTVDDWSIGARAALGAELWLLHRGWLPFETDFALGLAAEAFYDLSLHRDWTDDGIDPGELDPSGFGWLLGLVTRF
ncbi:MAG: hypothetical protein R3F65_31900 [bacterium]